VTLASCPLPKDISPRGRLDRPCRPGRRFPGSVARLPSVWYHRRCRSAIAVGRGSLPVMPGCADERRPAATTAPCPSPAAGQSARLCHLPVGSRQTHRKGPAPLAPDLLQGVLVVVKHVGLAHLHPGSQGAGGQQRGNRPQRLALPPRHLPQLLVEGGQPGAIGQLAGIGPQIPVGCPGRIFSSVREK